MQELFAYYKNKQDWDTAIDILKLILSIDEKDSAARKDLVDCFRGKYADHSQLEDYIRISNLTQSWRNVFEAISDFEKHIAFDAKNFVFHRSWGVGLIRKVKDDEISINFGKNSAYAACRSKWPSMHCSLCKRSHLGFKGNQIERRIGQND